MRNVVFGIAFFSVLLSLRTTQAQYSGGTGEANTPYRIADYNDLYTLADDTNDYNKCFVMTADIDLDPNLPNRRSLTTALIAPGWSVGFDGVLDGNNFVIANLTIDNNTLHQSLFGLFGNTHANCVIRSLGIEDVSIHTGVFSMYVGGLIGINKGTVIGCYSTGSVMAEDSSFDVGGLIGAESGSEGSISDCYSMCSVTCADDCIAIGGLAGSTFGDISNCYATGDVNAPGAWQVGGLLGSVGDDATPGGAVINCYATGSVSGSYDIGGLVGLNAGGAITECYATGSVFGSYDVGGLAGWNAKSGLTEFVYGRITDCYATGSVDGAGNVGGLAGDNDGPITTSYFLDPNDGGGPDNGLGEPLTDEEMKDGKTFTEAGWDFETPVWGICCYQDYPRFRWEWEPNEFPSCGSGEINEPYAICLAEQMNLIGRNTAFFDKHFVMVDDIDLGKYTGDQFNQIGYTDGHAFEGTFNGNGHTVSNFTYSKGINSYAGLFGYVDEAEAKIYNLTMVNPTVSGGASVGSLVGSLRAGTVRACCSEGGSVTGAGYFTGGLVGRNRGVVVESSSSTDVYGNTYAGGLVGYSQGFIESSFSNAQVHGDNRRIGGFAGGNDGTLLSCYASGTSEGPNRIGGFVGENNGAIVNCYSSTAISSGGGLVGHNEYPQTMLNSFWDVNASGSTSSAGGIGKTTEEMKTCSTFLGWAGDDSPWRCDGNDYPRLEWENIASGEMTPSLSDFLEGTGTDIEPYVVGTANDIGLVSLFAYEWDREFVVDADVDLRECTVRDQNVIIGVNAHVPFSGIFDGNEHIIEDFNCFSQTEYVGLFGYVDGTDAQIRDLGLQNVAIEQDTSSGGAVGPLVGCLANGQVTRCFARQGFAVAYGSLGGLVGENNGVIADCYSGLSVHGTSRPCLVYPTGGLVGFNGGQLQRCYSIGVVSANFVMGALVGDGGGSISSSYFLDGCGPDNGLGELLTNEEMKQQASFVDWDFIGPADGPNDIWSICEAMNYPKLSWSIPAADFICPDGVNFVDYSFFSEVWLADTCGVGNDFCGGRDLDESGIIDEEDLKILCGYWLDGI